MTSTSYSSVREPAYLDTQCKYTPTKKREEGTTYEEAEKEARAMARRQPRAYMAMGAPAGVRCGTPPPLLQRSGRPRPPQPVVTTKLFQSTQAGAASTAAPPLQSKSGSGGKSGARCSQLSGDQVAPSLSTMCTVYACRDTDPVFSLLQAGGAEWK